MNNPNKVYVFLPTMVINEPSIIKEEVSSPEEENSSSYHHTDRDYGSSLSDCPDAEVHDYAPCSEDEGTFRPGCSSYTDAVTKQELDIGPTELQPPDMHFTLQPCKPGPDYDKAIRRVQRALGYPPTKRMLVDLLSVAPATSNQRGNSPRVQRASGCPPAKRRLVDPLSVAPPTSKQRGDSLAMQPAIAVTTSPGGSVFVDPSHGAPVEKTPRRPRVRVARATATDSFWTEEEADELRRQDKLREKQAAVGRLPGMSSILTSMRRASTTDNATQDIDRWLDGQSASTVDEGVAVLQESTGPPPSPTVVSESPADEDLRDQAGTSSASFAVPVSVPVPDDPGSDVDDIGDDAHLLVLPRRVNTAHDLRDQVGTSSASFAVPVSVPVPDNTGNDVDDIEDDAHLLVFPRRVNTAHDLRDQVGTSSASFAVPVSVPVPDDTGSDVIDIEDELLMLLQRRAKTALDLRIQAAMSSFAVPVPDDTGKDVDNIEDDAHLLLLPRRANTAHDLRDQAEKSSASFAVPVSVPVPDDTGSDVDVIEDDAHLLLLPRRANTAHDLRDQAEKSSASFAVPVSVPVPDDTGSDVDVIEDDAHLLLLPRRVNTALALALPHPEQDPEAVALLDKVALAQDTADEEILVEASDTYDWTSDYSTYRGVQEVFTVPAPGPTIPDETPYGNFCKIWDRPILSYIADMTNLYAERKATEMYGTEENTEGERINSWKRTDIEELYVYFAILMYMAMDPSGSLKEYWITDSVLEMPKFRKLMTYDRFLLLNSMLHFVDTTTNLTADEDPKFAKLQPIIDHCNKKFQSCYILDQNLAIDESLTHWKGHLNWVQNIMSKVALIKTYELCETSTGYLWRFFVHTGKTCNAGDIGETSTRLFGKTSEIVLALMHDLTHKGYCLTMDNFYSSPALARHLKSVKTDCVGTLRVARKNVPEAIKRLTKETMARGETVAQHCGDVSLVAWNDAKLVTTISTFHNAETYLGRRGGKPRTKPIVIKDYNSAMRGVDLKDQTLSMYVLEQQSVLKWYVKMFRRLMNASILNAFTMYRRTVINIGRVSLSHREFRFALAAELVRRHSAPRNVPRSIASANRYDGLQHYLYPIKVQCTMCSIKKKDECNECKPVRRRCARCYELGRRKETRNECKKCAKALCLGACFEEYHTRQRN